MGRWRDLAPALLLCTCFFAPAVAAVATLFAPEFAETAQLGAEDLANVEVPAAPPSFSWRAFRDRSFQRELGRWFDGRFGARNLLVRAHNQLLYALFRRSYMSGDRIVVGERETLFLDDFLKSWFTKPPDFTSNHFSRMADKLVALQSAARKRGIPFVFVVTPHKALLQRDRLPNGAEDHEIDLFHRTEMLERLRAKGVPLVDGHEVTERFQRETGFEAFGAGGLHWNELAASWTWNAAVRELNSQVDRSFSEVAADDVSLREPVGADADLWEWLNLLDRRPRFRTPYGTLRATRPEHAGRPRLLMNGSSFSWELIHVVRKAGLFREIRFFYYTVAEWRFPGGEKVPLDGFGESFPPGAPWPDAIVIERNESQWLWDAEPFIDALLERLELG